MLTPYPSSNIASSAARSATRSAIAVVALVCGVFAGACGSGGSGGAPAPAATTTTAVARPSILLVTLDTTRADAIGPDAKGVQTPAFNAIAARGQRFRQAYTTVPETLPSHSSMMTGLYPGGHGVHENARHLSETHPVLAEKLRGAGYQTAAFISSFILARRFGIARGFDLYDDGWAETRTERSSKETTDQAIAYLARAPKQPLLVWVHYFDPHAPYAPPEPFRQPYAQTPYLGEIAAMDQQIGRLVQAFEQQAQGQGAPVAIVIAGDHGEGLGDHGESQHGHLLYQSTMQVPLVIAGPGVEPGQTDIPVSTRHIFDTVLDWAGLGSSDRSLRHPRAEIVLGEAMKPFLSYGWQPQLMAVEGRQKVIFTRTPEVYDVMADPGETHDIAASANLPAPVSQALNDYPIPSPDAARAPENLGDDARRRLASLGYVSAGASPVVRKEAPRPIDMVRLLDLLEQASNLFVQARYAQVIPLLDKILAADPHNLDAALRLATAHSSLGHDAQAEAAFKQAESIAPSSPDVRTYLALHYARTKNWERAVPLLERTLAETPERLPAVEALAAIRERQGRIPEAVTLRQKIRTLRTPTPAELVHLGQLAMSVQQTPVAIDAFEQARALQGAAFGQDLELGVLYLAARRFEEAKAALDRVPASHPDYPMALFKRAQVSVLLNEPDRAARIAQARQRANAATRELIARERLFQ
jgi:arylsulfatase A-like enzyme/tetratricopeptide (TPR) repeat protein